MLLREDSVNTRDQQENSTSACPVIPYWAVLGAAETTTGVSDNSHSQPPTFSFFIS